MVLTVFCLFCIVPVIAETSTTYWAPWVTKTSTTSATINWWQGTNGTGIIKYANASYYNQYNGFDKTIADAEVTQYHHVLLTGLDTNTSYKYWVQPLNHETVFNNRTFRTMPVSGPFTFIVISDTHANENRFRYVADALNSEQDALFILFGGDFANNDNASEWTDFFDYGDGMLANYSIYTNIGNHEYHGDSSTDAYQYRNAFDYPLNYSFDCAGIRFVVLDSPDPNNADDQNPTLAHSESQASWLKDQLDSNMSGTFVIDHHPVWTYGRASSDSALQPWETLFQKYPISADFSGHIHSYQRFSVNGIPYFIVANGGGKFINLSDGKPFPSSKVYGATKELGYLRVTVDQANNTATANEYFVASLPDYNSTTGTVINPPLLADSITFPLKINLSPPEPSGIPITAPAVISSPGHYRLTNNLFNSTANTAILITASDVILDGGGHTLNGALAFNTTGVLAGDLPGNLSNITIINLTVTGWEQGILISTVTESALTNIQVTGNQGGIRINGSTGITVRNCTVTDNIPWEEQGVYYGGNGVNIENSPGTHILDSTISHNGWGKGLPSVGGTGIIAIDSPGLLISGCVINTNVNTGILNQNSKDGMLLGNELIHNGGNGGIFMTALAENPVLNTTIEDNTISESGWGIWLMMNDHLVRNNTVSNCGYGIFLDTSRNATLTGNVMLNNEMNFGVDGQEIANYLHHVDTSNTVNGQSIYYLVNQSGAVVEGVTGAGTVYGISCPNLTICDLTLENNEYGVFLLESSGAVIRNVTATENSNGFSISKSDNPSIETCTARANTNNGFLIQDSDGLQITGSDAFMNKGGMDVGTGISIGNCQDILLWNVTANQNNFAGIDLEGTDRASLVNVTAGENTVVGIILGGDSIQVTGCHIQDNHGPGIGMLDSTNITMWNNFFSNDENIDISNGLVTGSFWNISKTAGINIVSGSFLGGNYWASPDGTGWSQITPDRGDGFCNAPFVIDANNTDYLPLHVNTSTSNVGVFRGGVFYRNGADAIVYGLPTDTPIIGDWNGDGISEVGVFRGGVFYRNGADAVVYGIATDTPVIGDWNGDGISEVGVYRDGVFYRKDATDIVYGLSTDTPVIGDWNGDGISEVGVFRDGVFYRNGATDIVYGLPTDTPIIGDWNGDGISEVGVFRGGVFYRNGATDIVYGLPTDTPIIGKWI